MGPVTDDEEAPPSTDELTPDQNRQAEEARLAFCGPILKTMREIGRLVDGTNVAAPVQLVVKALPALAKLKEASGTNFARAIRNTVLDGEPRTLLPEGWLIYQPATGKKDSHFVFKPRG